MSLTFLITAGPTQEPLDPVRYLSNYSSGKMGYALARAALQRGHRVILITGPTALVPPKGARVIRVTTAGEMYRQVMRHYKKAHVIFKVAAVADYRPAKVSKQKIKKTKKNETLKLVRNPDILKALGRKVKKNQILVGFAAETKNGLVNAKKKLSEKKCDWIILNQVNQKGIGFNSDTNQVTLLSQKGQIWPLKRATKKRLAGQILTKILSTP